MDELFWMAPVCVGGREAEAGGTRVEQAQEEGTIRCTVTIEGRTLAKSFWGKSWCTNLERYSDFENRLPRDRTYVRNGSVVDLQITKGEVAAMVAGSELYKIKIAISPVMTARWKSNCRRRFNFTRHLLQLKVDQKTKPKMKSEQRFKATMT